MFMSNLQLYFIAFYLHCTILLFYVICINDYYIYLCYIHTQTVLLCTVLFGYNFKCRDIDILQIIHHAEFLLQLPLGKREDNNFFSYQCWCVSGVEFSLAVDYIHERLYIGTYTLKHSQLGAIDVCDFSGTRRSTIATGFGRPKTIVLLPSNG